MSDAKTLRERINELLEEARECTDFSRQAALITKAMRLNNQIQELDGQPAPRGNGYGSSDRHM